MEARRTTWICKDQIYGVEENSFSRLDGNMESGKKFTLDGKTLLIVRIWSITYLTFFAEGERQEKKISFRLYEIEFPSSSIPVKINRLLLASFSSEIELNGESRFVEKVTILTRER